MNKTLTTLFLLLSIPFISYGQGYVSTDYLSSSSFKDDNGNKYGSGNLMILSGRYTLPISAKQNVQGKSQLGQQRLIVAMEFSTMKQKQRS